MSVLSIYDQEFSSPSSVFATKFRTATRTADGSNGLGDSASFSQDALTALGNQIAGNDRLTSSSVSTTLDDGNGKKVVIDFNNKSGAISWNNHTLQLKGFADPLTDDLAVKETASGIEVYNLSNGQKITLNSDGTQKKIDGALDPASVTTHTSKAADLSVALFINNQGGASHTGAENDIVINRQAGAQIDAGDGDDKIFNFAATAGKLSGGGGNDSVYSVGLTSETAINVDGGNGYVKLIGNMTGGNIQLGDGVNLVDASGYTLNGVTISDKAAATASAVIANTVNNNGKINLNAAQAALDVRLLSSSQVNFGSGANSLVADKVTGTAENRSVISSRGINTYKLGAINQTDINSAEAISDAITASGNISDAKIDLSKGNNLLDAGKYTLTNVQITSKPGGTGSSTILAGAMAGRNSSTQRSSIELAGSADGNTVSVAKSVKYTDIDTGSGAGSVHLGSFDSGNVRMGGPSSDQAQDLTVNGNVSNMNYSGAQGEDKLTILGTLKNSSLNLGEGDNDLIVESAKGLAQAISNTDIYSAGSGSTTIRAGNFTYGADGNRIELGSGANQVDLGAVKGSGKTGLNISVAASSAAQSLNINGGANYLTYTGSAGDDAVHISGAVTNSHINLGEGNNTFAAVKSTEKVSTAQSVSNTDILAAGSGATTVTTGNFTYGAEGNSIELGSGANAVNLGGVSGKGTEGLIIKVAASDKDQVLNINGNANYLTYTGSSGADTINISGAVAHSYFDLGEGDNAFTAVKDTGKTATPQNIRNTDIKASGSGSTTITAGGYSYGADGNYIELGAGANEINLGTVSGKGKEGLKISLAATTEDQTLNINGSAKYLTYTGSSGADTLNISGALSNSSLDLGEGDNTLSVVKNTGKAAAAQAVSNTDIKASGTGSNSVTMGKYTYGVEGNSLELGAGPNTINMGAISGKGTEGLRISTGETTAEQTLNISGSAKYLTYTGSSGADTLNISGALSNSYLDLGDGDNILNAVLNAAAKTTAQTVSNTEIRASGSGGTKINIGKFSVGRYGNSIELGSGPNILNMGSALGKGAYGLDISIAEGDAEQILNINGGASRLTYTGSSGADSINVSGSISNSSFELGDGDNSLSAVLSTAKKTTAQKVSNTVISAEGSGANTVNIGKTVNLTYTGSSGTDTLNISGAVSGSVIDLGDGDNVFNAVLNTASKTTAQSVTNTEILMSGDGNNSLRLGKYTAGDRGGTINLGAGANTVSVDSVVAKGSTGLSIITAETTQGQTINLAGAVKNFTFQGSSGADTVNVSGSITNGYFDLGEGANTYDASAVKNTATDVHILAQGDEGNKISLYNLTSTKKGASSISLGNGANTVGIAGQFSGIGLVEMGGNADNTFNANNISGTVVINSSGGGTYNIGTANNTTFNFTESSQNILMNVSTALSGAKVNLGLGDFTLAATGAKPAADLIGTLINAGGGNLTVDMRKMSSSAINMNTDRATAGNGTLSLTLSGAMTSSDVDLAGGEAYIDAAGGLNKSTIRRTVAGTLLLNSGEMKNALIDLTGEGKDVINVKGNMHAKVDLGEGEDLINVTGSISGELKAKDNLTLNAAKMNNADVKLSGDYNLLTVTEAISNSSIYLGDGVATVGVAETNYSNVEISGGDGNQVINGNNYAGGSITLGSGDNTVNITGAISAKVSLGSGSNTLGAEDTDLAGLKFYGTGNNLIQGRNLSGGEIYLEGEGMNNQVLLKDQILNSLITLVGGNNTIGGTAASLVASNIIASGAGTNTILADSMKSGSIRAGESDDTVEIFGNIENAEIDLGGGVNILRNTRTTEEAGSAGAGHGSALEHSVKNSNITLGGESSVYLGRVESASNIAGDGKNDLHIVLLQSGNIDASSMAAGHSINVGTSSGSLSAGADGAININNMQAGHIIDSRGGSTITVGALAAGASINIKDAVDSTTVRVNDLSGAVSLDSEAYASNGKLIVTSASNPATYAGSVLVGGAASTGAATGTPNATDTSQFGL